MKRIIIATFLVMGLTLSLVLLKPNSNYQKIEKEELKSSNLIGIYLKDTDEQEYYQVNEIPNEGNYALNKENSYCLKPDNKENKIKDMLEYNEYNKTLSVSKLEDNKTKCFLYFDKKKSSKEMLEYLELKSLGTITSFTGTACDDGTNAENHNTSGSNCTMATQNKGIYEAEDDYGISYYFRGTIDNNWVKLGTEYWRIIRINGDGTLRLIYSGTEVPNDGRWVSNVNVVKSIKYNDFYSDNKYVGFMYGIEKSGSDRNETAPGITTSYEQAHENNIKSNALTSLEGWFNNNELKNYIKFLDGATGFCNDRQINDKDDYTWWNEDPTLANRGYGKNKTAYAAFHRIRTSSNGWATINTPILTCGNKTRDLFTTNEEKGYGNGALTYPVGLITMDEVLLAGGFGGKSNYGYWLYTGEYYFTMTPGTYNGVSANVYIVYSDGWISDPPVYNTSNIRPVINLKSNTPFEPSNNNGDWGTISNPFVVKIN